ncbi:MAG TPA: hypothetical protein VGB17_01075 [Pyrinomonadaceae bacterium]|jgi:hypothetical protein
MSKFIIAVLTLTLAAASVLGQNQSAPTLRIVTEDPNLPSELYYGNVKVKPLLLRPGTNQVITIDDADFFISQHYVDFLNRFADAGGLGYWTDQITRCGTDAVCINKRRVAVSAAFFIELEFQQTGSFVYRLYKGGLGRQPVYNEFMPDRRLVVANANLEQNKAAFAEAFVQRAEFVQKYQSATTADTFVDALLATVKQSSKVDLTSLRSALISKYNTGSNLVQSRSLVVRDLIEDASFKNAEYYPSFVLMQYFGYLKRDPDPGGYLFWLDVLTNKEPGNFKGMVCSFITSAEYQQRFGSTITRSNRDCASIR